MASFAEQVAKQFGIKPEVYNAAAHVRGATTQAPTRRVATMTASQRTARKLLRADPVHQGFQFCVQLAQQENVDLHAYFSAMADRALNSSGDGDGGVDDEGTAWLADAARYFRMKASETARPEDLQAAHGDLCTRLATMGPGSDSDAGDEGDGDVENPPADKGNLLAVERQKRGMTSATSGPAPSPVDHYPNTGTPRFLAEHSSEHPSTGGLLLNVTRRQLKQRTHVGIGGK